MKQSMKTYETIKHAMKRTGYSRNTLMRFDKPGITVRVGKAIRFDADALDEALANGLEHNMDNT